MSRCLAIMFLIGCSAPPLDETPPDPTPEPAAIPTATPTDVEQPPTPTPEAPAQPTPRLVPGAAVTCADPEARDALGPFRLSSTAVPNGDLEWIHGSGAAMTDLDDDGELEILQTSLATIWQHHPQPDGSFRSVALYQLPMPESRFDGFFGTYPADFDGDGDLDLLVTQQGGANLLLANDGSGTWTNIAAAAGLQGPASHMSSGAAWGDIDNDGDLDLFIGGYSYHATGMPIDQWPDGNPSLLFLNDGDGTFTDVSHRLPAETAAAYTFGGGWEDFDRDGDLDLYIYQDIGFLLREGNVLLLNDGQAGFTIDDSTGLTIEMSAMGLGMGDLNQDGRVDLSISGWRDQRLFLSSGDLWFESADALNLTSNTAIRQDVGWGNEIVDLDNDADLDVAVVYGVLDLTVAVHQDDQPDGLYLQLPNGSFHDQASGWGFADTRSSRSIAVGDLNHDGWADLAVTGPAGHLLVYQSRCGSEAWLEVDLLGVEGNTRGIGAVVTVQAGGRSHRQRLYAGGTGYASSNEDTLHVGLGSAVVVNQLEILWPDGATQQFNDVDVRQRVQILHPDR